MTDEIDYNSIIWPAQLTQGIHRSIYPFLEPSNLVLSAVGKSVLITGVSGGIGRAIAQAWTTAGARVIVITGRKVDILQDVKKQLDEPKWPETKIFVVAADITKENDVERLWK
jgi:NADP-dependent 3-hydroxy acid dehydrogenase YdfG